MKVCRFILVDGYKPETLFVYQMCLDAESRVEVAVVELLGRPEEGSLATDCGPPLFFKFPKIRNNTTRTNTTLVVHRVEAQLSFHAGLPWPWAAGRGQGPWGGFSLSVCDWSNFEPRYCLKVVRRYREEEKEEKKNSCGFFSCGFLYRVSLAFLPRFFFFFFSPSNWWIAAVPPEWERLAESPLTAGAAAENGGCDREGMQRAGGTLPSCYRRHEGTRLQHLIVSKLDFAVNFQSLIALHRMNFPIFRC